MRSILILEVPKLKLAEFKASIVMMRLLFMSPFIRIYSLCHLVLNFQYDTAFMKHILKVWRPKLGCLLFGTSRVKLFTTYRFLMGIGELTNQAAWISVGPEPDSLLFACAVRYHFSSPEPRASGEQ